MFKKIVIMFICSASLTLSLMSVEVSAATLEYVNMPQRPEPQLYEGEDITGILDFIDKNTLVVFDIDDTLFRAKTAFGSSEWGSRLIKAEMAKGSSFQESVRKIMPLWFKAQKFNVLTLVDERIPKLLTEIRKQSLGCIAFTTRQPSALEITRWQLDKFGISFGKGTVAELKYGPSFRHPTLYQEGVLFTHDFNESAAVFQDWVQQVAEQLGRSKQIKKVVFIDDSFKHIRLMRDAVDALEIAFVGLRYSATDDYKKTYNSDLAAKEKDILMQNVSDTEIHLLLEEAGSYAETLAQAR